MGEQTKPPVSTGSGRGHVSAEGRGCAWCAALHAGDYEFPTALDDSFCPSHRVVWLVLATGAWAYFLKRITKARMRQLAVEGQERALKVAGIQSARIRGHVVPVVSKVVPSALSRRQDAATDRDTEAEK